MSPSVVPSTRPLPLVARLGHGAAGGLVAAAATSGALVAFGVRDGNALRAFVELGRDVLAGAPVESVAAQHAAATVGILAHVAAACGWGALLGAVAAGWRGWRLTVATIAVTVAAGLAQRAAAPALLRPGHETTASAPQTGRVALLYCLLAGGLAVGMRVAFPPVSLDERTP